MFIYSLKDLKSDYGNLMLFNSDELAIRAFKNLLADDQKTLLTLNPDDFELFCLGSIDKNSGIITSDVKFVANSAMFRNL